MKKILLMLTVPLLPMMGLHAETILQHQFDGDAGDNLHGVALDVGDQSWRAGDAFKADGTIGPVSGGGVGAWVDFVPEAGYVYTLGAVLTVNPDTIEWLALGFVPQGADDRDTTGSSARHAAGGIAWAFHRNNPDPNALINQRFFGGPGVSNSLGDFKIEQDTMHVAITLDATDGENVLASVSFGNGAGVIAPQNIGRLADLGINAVGISANNNAAGRVDDFQLTATLDPIIEMPFERKFGSVRSVQIIDELTSPQGAYRLGAIGEGDDLFGDAIEVIEDGSGNGRDAFLAPIGVAEFSDNVADVVSGSTTSLALPGNVPVDVVDYKGVTGPGPRSIAAWIYPTALTGFHNIVEWGDEDPGTRWTMRMDANRLRVEVAGGFVIGEAELPVDSWTHVAATFDGSNVLDVKLFVNGVEQEIASSNGQAIDTGEAFDVAIGYSPVFNGRWFQGFIDEFGIWSRALDAEDIADLASGAVLVSDLSGNLELSYDMEGEPGPLPIGAGTVVTSLPAELSGELALAPEPATPESASVGFVVDPGTTVSLAFAKDREVPAWLANHYDLTSLTLDTTAGAFDVWQRDLQAREYLVLPAGHQSLAFLGFGPDDVVADFADAGLGRTSPDPDAWRREDHNWRLTSGPEFAVHEAAMFSEVVNFDAQRGFKLATTIRVPRLQDAGDNAIGFSLLGDGEAGIRAEWLPRMAGGGSDLRLVNAANEDILQSASWTGVTPNAIDNDVGVGEGAEETVFAVGEAPFSGTNGVILASEDFEGDVSGWSSESMNQFPDQWEIGIPTSGPQGAFEGQNVAATRLDGIYGPMDSASVLRSPQIDLTTAASPRLTFREYMDVDTATSSVDGSLLHFGTISVRDVDTDQVEELVRYSEDILQWTEREIDLSGFAGRVIEIEFGFFTDDYMVDAGDGWYLDAIQISDIGTLIEEMPEKLTFDSSLNGIATDPEGVSDESDSHLQFTVVDRSATGNEGVSVFVAWDVRASGMEPDWLRGAFTMTDHFVAVSQTRHRLWLREYPNGAEVTLGGASADGLLPEGTNNYFVLFGDARLANERFHTLTAEGAYEDGSWNLEFSLSDGSQTRTVSAGVAESLTVGHTFGIFARHPDAGGQTVTHSPVWEIFDFSMDFLIDVGGFEAWREQYFAGQLDNLAISGPEADPAGDGVKNLIKYALNLPPWEPVVMDDLFERTLSDGDLILVYRKRTDIDDIEYIPEVSEDLMNWNRGEPHVIESVLGEEEDYQEIQALGVVSPESPTGFIRLMVRQKE